MDSRRLRIALLITAVVLNVQTNEIEQESSIGVRVEVSVDYKHVHNRSELTCEAPEKPLNGGYASDVGGDRYNTGDTITYYCNGGYQLIGQVNRICNGSSKEWEPKQPYCERKRKTVGLDRLLVCTGNTTATDEDTVTKCMTMQMGVRNGRSVSVYTFVIQDYNSKVAQGGGFHYSQPFYHTVPGYKFRLSGFIHHTANIGNIGTFLQLLPGEYDDQLKWPVNPKHEVTVLTNDGLEAPESKSLGDSARCYWNRPTSALNYHCTYADLKWDDVWRNKKHILDDGSVVVKLYFSN